MLVADTVDDEMHGEGAAVESPRGAPPNSSSGAEQSISSSLVVKGSRKEHGDVSFRLGLRRFLRRIQSREISCASCAIKLEVWDGLRSCHWLGLQLCRERDFDREHRRVHCCNSEVRSFFSDTELKLVQPYIQSDVRGMLDT